MTLARLIPWLIGLGGLGYLFSQHKTLDKYSKAALPYVQAGVILLGAYVILEDVIGYGAE